MNNYIVICIFYNVSFSQQEKWKFISSKIPVVIVDNSKKTSAFFFQKSDVIYIPLMQNKGIAEAQNIGIQKAKKLGCKYVFFFDQDSEFDVDFPTNLINEYKRIKTIQPNLAFLGPRIINQSTGDYYKSNVHNFSCGFDKADAIISSGSLIELTTLEKIGFMESSLFIDYVDFEICWRAKAKGYVNGITNRVALQHKVGETDKSFLGYPIIISSAFRYFYQYRNFFVLLRRDYVPTNWKIKMFIRKLVELVYVPVYLKSGNVLFNMLKGIVLSFFYKRK